MRPCPSAVQAGSFGSRPRVKQCRHARSALRIYPVTDVNWWVTPLQAALGVAFVVEGLLLGFHLKGSSLEVVVHKILVITIALSAVIMFAEIRSKGSVLLTVARALLVILQGVWFIQIGRILYFSAPLARRLFSTTCDGLCFERLHTEWVEGQAGPCLADVSSYFPLSVVHWSKSVLYALMGPILHSTNLNMPQL